MQGILFKEVLFEQIIAGNKTQTRRLISNNKGFRVLNGQVYKLLENGMTKDEYLKPRYKSKSKVFLKEPYTYTDETKSKIDYMFDLPKDNDLRELRNYWRNKLFMPAKAARYFIEIKAVSNERLWDISEEDAKAEGVALGSCVFQVMRNGLGEGIIEEGTYRGGFFNAWRAINGMDSLRSNPYVWVYNFKL